MSKNKFPKVNDVDVGKMMQICQKMLSTSENDVDIRKSKQISKVGLRGKCVLKYTQGSKVFPHCYFSLCNSSNNTFSKALINIFLLQKSQKNLQID